MSDHADKPQAKLIYQRVVEERDALLAENQRLRDALEQISAIDSAKHIGAPYLEALRLARAALAAVREENE